MSAAVIGIIAHAGKTGARRMAATLFEEFTQRGAIPLLEEKTAASIHHAGGHGMQELSERCELLVALGGDGTILRVLKDLGDASTPILGINLGSLGFLTCVSSHDAMRAVDSILARDYQLSQRHLLRVTVHRDGQQIATQRALNDVVLNRGHMSRMIRSEALVNGNLITSYHADGIIVATATGSTAYALAAGGPIVAPHAGVFVITPICPHVLTNRPVIVDDEAHIEILLSPGQHDLALNVDGAELVKVQSGDHIIIHKARRSLSLAIPPGTTFFDVLREKAELERERAMITFDSLLAPKFVDLDLKATNHPEAIAHVAGLLRNDPRVADWHKLCEAIQARSPGVAGGRDFDISIPHARTDAVNTMVMSIGRSVQGIEFQENGTRVHYIFVIGVPIPLAADYLRIVGAIARIFRNPRAEALMRSTDDPLEFIHQLAAGEMKH